MPKPSTTPSPLSSEQTPASDLPPIQPAELKAPELTLFTPYGPVLLDQLRLDDRQRTFVLQYLHHGKAEQAAIEAGFNPKTARVRGYQFFPALVASPADFGKLRDFEKACWAAQMHRHATVIAADKRAMDVAINDLGLSKAWVLQRWMQIAERCMTAEPVMVRGDDGEMIESGEYRFDSRGANRALELLAKSMGMFVDRKHITVERYDDMAPDQLDGAIDTMSAQLEAINAKLARLTARDAKPAPPLIEHEAATVIESE